LILDEKEPGFAPGEVRPVQSLSIPAATRPQEGLGSFGGSEEGGLLARIIHESGADSRFGRFSDGFVAMSAAVHEKRRPAGQCAGVGDVFGRHEAHLSPSRVFEFVGGGVRP
jgi:hypothetical protein